MGLSKAYHEGTTACDRMQYSDEAMAAPRHFNALEHTANVLDASRALSDRVQSMVSRFIGAYPIPAEGPDAATGGPGIFHQLHRVSDETGYAIRKANEALDRLEKELA